MNFPTRDEYYDFIKFITSSDTVSLNERTRYNNALKKYNSVENLLNLGTSASSRLIVYSSLKYNQKISDSLIGMNIFNGEGIIRYFNTGNHRFFSICNEKIEGSESWYKIFFYPLLVRSLIFLGKSNIDDVGYSDLKILYCDTFLSCHVHSRPFINLLATIIGEYSGKALPNIFHTYVKTKDEYELYGTQHTEIQTFLNKYLEDEYMSRGINVAHPLKGLKTFGKWLYENYPEITNVNSLKRENWLKFQEFIFETFPKNSTRRHKLHTVSKFLKWLQRNKFVLDIIGFSEKIKISNSDVESTTEPRHFESREQFNIILSKILTIKPTNEKEVLIKHLLLIASATGLRVNEVLWLGPGCLTLTKGDVGEIILQIREKQGLKNKPMSILPWGIESIGFLEERYKMNNEGKKPTVYYHKQSRKYFPSLFEFEGRVISVNTANIEINKLIREIEEEHKDENLNYKKGSKFHGFRHQKFNDILEVTGGSVAEAKLDSYHESTKMLLSYSKQSKEKRQEEAYRALDEGKIVGKYADILKQLLLTPYSPEEYVEVVKKLNLSSFVSKEGLKRAMKYLGFGYCGAEKCKLAPVCESCDYFWTCNTFSDELAERYAINFVLVKSRQNEIMTSSTQDYSLITSLKYQEKWLYELGFDESSIIKLRTKYIGKGFN